MDQKDKRKLFHTLFFPLFFVLILWVIKSIELVFEKDFGTFGVYPREITGLIGIFTSPLIHADFSHLFSNSIPLVILGSGLFYYYRPFAYNVFFWIYIATGLWVWISARPAYHIGASGIVYGLAAFLFFSGIIRGNNKLMAFSLLVAFLYGSMFWGILPLVERISWESHLLGGVAGLLCAIYYRKEGPQKEVYHWDEQDEIDQFEEENEVPEADNGNTPKINYLYIPREDKQI